MGIFVRAVPYSKPVAATSAWSLEHPSKNGKVIRRELSGTKGERSHLLAKSYFYKSGAYKSHVNSPEHAFTPDPASVLQPARKRLHVKVVLAWAGHPCCLRVEPRGCSPAR